MIQQLQELVENKTFCVMPFVHLATTPPGEWVIDFCDRVSQILNILAESQSPNCHALLNQYARLTKGLDIYRKQKNADSFEKIYKLLVEDGVPLQL